MRFTWKILLIFGLTVLLLITHYDLGLADFVQYIYQPSIEITIGECQWDGTQSKTEVTFSATDTTLTVYKPSGGFFPVTASTSPRTAYLPSGGYDYTWKDDYDPTYGIWLTTVEGSFELPSCAPQASVTLTPGECQWDSKIGSINPIAIELDHAELTLNGVFYTTSPSSVNLSPGDYSYSWVPTNGYQGGATNQTLTVGNCNPTTSVSHTLGNCVYNDSQSITSVQFNITGADVVVNGSSGDVYYPSPTSPLLSLPAGFYTYNWNILPYYNGENGSRSFTLGTCVPASVSYIVGDCDWNTQPPSRDLSFTVSGATATLDGPGGPYLPFAANAVFENLISGIYSFNWVANPGYAGSEQVDIELPVCQPGVASVTVNFIACGFDDQNNPYGEVTVSLTGSELSINEEVYDETTTLFLPPGNYDYSWWAKPGFEGEGEGEIDTSVCLPKATPEVVIEIGSCSIKNDQSLTEVHLFISGAELALTNSEGDLIGPYSSSQTISLLPGEYHYEWKSTTGDGSQGEGKFTITACETEKESDIQDKENGDKEEEIVDYDPTPDYPAGGIVPSFLLWLILIFSVALTLIRYFLLYKG
jgi:hypothetical protein